MGWQWKLWLALGLVPVAAVLIVMAVRGRGPSEDGEKDDLDSWGL